MTAPSTTRAAISGKVANGTIGGTAVTLITWALTFFIPAWQSAIPSGLQALLPGILGAVGFYISGYASKHQATTDEVIAALKKGELVIAEIEAAIQPATGSRRPGTGR